VIAGKMILAYAGNQTPVFQRIASYYTDGVIPEPPKGVGDGQRKTLATRTHITKIPSTKYTSLQKTELKIEEFHVTQYIILHHYKLFFSHFIYQR
jgi:hypothetical protein